MALVASLFNESSLFLRCYDEFDKKIPKSCATELLRREVMLTFMLGILPVQGPRAFNSDLPDDIFRSIAAHLPRLTPDAGTSSLICFGRSGVGKSTFLARLLSGLDPSAFAAALPKSGGKNVTIAGVEIGPGMETTTLVPVMHRAGGHLQIFDAPGFKDPDETRQLVINILQKCLLTRIKRARFLVFVKVQDLFDEMFQPIIDDYHNKLKELVGAGGYEYEEFLNSLHFVFTHNDRAYDGETYTSEQITERCEDLTFNIVAAEVKNELLPEFVMRMGEAHTLVDYSTQTSEELRQSIESSSAVPADAVLTVNIDTHIDTHDLNRQCARLLAAKQQALEIKNRERSDDWGKAVTKVLKHKELLHVAQEQRAALVAKKEPYGGILAHEDQALASLEAETAKAQRDLQEASKRAEAHRPGIDLVADLEAEIPRAEKDVESKTAEFETACDGANAALAKFEQDWSDATNEISLISAVARIFEQNDLATDLQRDVAKYAELSNTMHDAILKAREELHSASCIVPEGVPGQPMPEPEPEPSGR